MQLVCSKLAANLRTQLLVPNRHTNPLVIVSDPHRLFFTKWMPVFVSAMSLPCYCVPTEFSSKHIHQYDDVMRQYLCNGVQGVMANNCGSDDTTIIPEGESVGESAFDVQRYLTVAITDQCAVNGVLIYDYDRTVGADAVIKCCHQVGNYMSYPIYPRGLARHPTAAQLIITSGALSLSYAIHARANMAIHITDEPC
jgi:hypothetical protein